VFLLTEHKNFMNKNLKKTLSCSLAFGTILSGIIPVSATGETSTFTYETYSQETTYKSSDEKSWADDNLKETRERAVRKLKNTVVRSNYRRAEQSQIDSIISSATSQINNASSSESINAIVSNAQYKLKALKTDAQYSKEEKEEANRQLASKKASAKTELANYKNKANYRTEGQAQINSLLIQAGERIDNATNISSVDSLISTYKQKLDAIKTASQLNAEESKESAQNDSNTLKAKKASAKAELSKMVNLNNYSDAVVSQMEKIISNARTNIDNASSVGAIESILSQAKSQLNSVSQTNTHYTTQNKTGGVKTEGGSAFEQNADGTTVKNTSNQNSETSKKNENGETTKENTETETSKNETETTENTVEDGSSGAVKTSDNTPIESNTKSSITILGIATTLLAGVLLTKKSK